MARIPTKMHYMVEVYETNCQRSAPLHLVTVIVEEDRINTPFSSPAAFVRQGYYSSSVRLLLSGPARTAYGLGPVVITTL